jgi:hypothetical protein
MLQTSSLIKGKAVEYGYNAAESMIIGACKGRPALA